MEGRRLTSFFKRWLFRLFRRLAIGSPPESQVRQCMQNFIYAAAVGTPLELQGALAIYAVYAVSLPQLHTSGPKPELDPRFTIAGPGL